MVDITLYYQSLLQPLAPETAHTHGQIPFCVLVRIKAFYGCCAALAVSPEAHGSTLAAFQMHWAVTTFKPPGLGLSHREPPP